MNRFVFPVILILGGALYFASTKLTNVSSRTLSGDTGVVSVVTDDPGLATAISDAQNTLDLFLTRAKSEGRAWDGAYLKVGFPTSDNTVEHIWVVGFNRTAPNAFVGLLSNEPVDLPGLRYGSEVTFNTDMISDWGFIQNGQGYGYYTIRELLNDMSPEDAAEAGGFLAETPLPAHW